jgi:galactose-6-phosphate isomerase
MPLLDVAEILLDPDFVDSLVCARNTQTVNDSGIATDTAATIPFYGVVTNNSGDLLLRLAEGSRISGSITVHSQFLLQAGSDGQDADIVTWNGRQYTVTNVGDWSRFGRGFTAANCELIPLSGGSNGQ